MQVTLIRHGQTNGNLENRYIGTTDEHLCTMGITNLKTLLKRNLYPTCDYVYTSPQNRCRETARLLFEEAEQHIVNDLKEKDFGEFENKNYNDLKGNKLYVNWCKSVIPTDFPTGENMEHFKSRCFNAFLHIINNEIDKNKNSVVIVCHGGTIMSIMYNIKNTSNNFYKFKINNGNGFSFNYDIRENEATNIKRTF